MSIGMEDGVFCMEFGTGDICVAGGLCDVLDETIGSVMFIDQEPTGIGVERNWCDEKGGGYPVLSTQIEETRCIMRFTKTESIDVVISMLEEAKRQMLEDAEGGE